MVRIVNGTKSPDTFVIICETSADHGESCMQMARKWFKLIYMRASWNERYICYG